LCRHDHETSFGREVAMVFGFSWLVEKMMNGNGQGIKRIVVKVDIVKNDNN